MSTLHHFFNTSDFFNGNGPILFIVNLNLENPFKAFARLKGMFNVWPTKFPARVMHIYKAIIFCQSQHLICAFEISIYINKSMWRRCYVEVFVLAESIKHHTKWWTISSLLFETAPQWSQTVPLWRYPSKWRIKCSVQAIFLSNIYLKYFLSIIWLMHRVQTRNYEYFISLYYISKEERAKNRDSKLYKYLVTWCLHFW